MKNNVLTVFLYGKIWPESRYKATFCHSALTLWRSHFIRWNIPCMPSPSPSIFRHRAIVQTNRVQLSGRCNWRSRQKLLICNVWRRSMEAFTCIRCYFYSRLQEPVHCWQTRNVNWGKWQVGFSESVSETCRREWRKKADSIISQAETVLKTFRQKAEKASIDGFHINLISEFIQAQLNKLKK